MSSKYPNYEERDSREDAEEGRAKPQDNSPEAVAEREYWRKHYAAIDRQEGEEQRRFYAEHPEIKAAIDAKNAELDARLEAEGKLQEMRGFEAFSSWLHNSEDDDA